MPTIAEIIETSDNDNKIDSIQATPTNLTEEKRDMATNIQETSIQLPGMGLSAFPFPEDDADPMDATKPGAEWNPEITYKLRAETPSGIIHALGAILDGMDELSTNENHMWIGALDFTIPPGAIFPDQKLTFEAGRVDLNLLREWIGRVPDSHVMVESLDLAIRYTGERYYNPRTGEENRTAEAAE